MQKPCQDSAQTNPANDQLETTWPLFV